MSNFSRTKKNEELYEQLNTDRETEVKTEGLSRYANRLNALDEDQFEKMSADATSNEATHARRAAYFEQETVKPTPTFHNEYLDEFIDEVKQYNIKKGLRSVEDTQTNILNELRKKPIEPSRIEKEEVAPEIVTVPEENSFRQDISAQLQTMMQEKEPEQPLQEEPVVIEKEDTSKIKEELMAQTAELKKQIDDYEDELTHVNSRVSNTNKLLNFVLVLLFLSLLVVLGCLVYYVLLNRGLLS